MQNKHKSCVLTACNTATYNEHKDAVIQEGVKYDSWIYGQDSMGGFINRENNC
jgi:hypothetical protein